MDEKQTTVNIDAASASEGSQNAALPRPSGWMYREWKLGPWTIPHYASPQVQIVVVAFICFLCPGMFNALNGMGGGGLLDKQVSAKTNTAVYSTFAVVGFFAGSFTNRLGVRTALMCGGIGYSVYVSSYLCFKHTANYGYSVFAGALLGCCAGLLWSAQGAIMMSYPKEGSKGKYISWFWMIFNMGAVIGGLIPLGQNIHQTAKADVSDGTYIGFLILTVLGALLSLALVNAKKVVRTDGSKVILMKNPTWKTELLGLWETLRSDPYIVTLFPMFFASNWFYTYHFNDFNGAVFNLRTAALNNVLYYLMQILAAYAFGYALDVQRFSRPTRAKAAWAVMLVLTMVVWGGGFEFQKTYTRDQIQAATDDPASPQAYRVIDWEEGRYVGPMFLYMFYGFYDAAWQTTAYWLMGALTNNSRKLANYAGFYKGIQSAGAAIIWSLDDAGIPYWNIFGSTWGLLAGSLVCALPIILVRVQDTVPLEQDLAFSDETKDEIEAKEGGKAERLDRDAGIDDILPADKA